jgi:hypothetical protein
MLDTLQIAIKLKHHDRRSTKMVRAKRLIEVIVSSVFVYGLTVIGFRIEEPVMGLIAIGIVYLYFKADFSK